MQCEEVPELSLKDDAVRIFLNTHGTNTEGVSEELVELLKYMEHTTEEVSRTCASERIHNIQKRIRATKSSEKIGEKYIRHSCAALSINFLFTAYVLLVLLHSLYLNTPARHQILSCSLSVLLLPVCTLLLHMQRSQRK